MSIDKFTQGLGRLFALIVVSIFFGLIIYGIFNLIYTIWPTYFYEMPIKVAFLIGSGIAIVKYVFNSVVEVVDDEDDSNELDNSDI